MGHIKEPKGVDFVINSEPLTTTDRKMISDFILKYKQKTFKVKLVSKKKTQSRNKILVS